jgi:hypothetical protein
MARAGRPAGASSSRLILAHRFGRPVMRPRMSPSSQTAPRPLGCARKGSFQWPDNIMRFTPLPDWLAGLFRELLGGFLLRCGTMIEYAVCKEYFTITGHRPGDGRWALAGSPMNALLGFTERHSDARRRRHNTKGTPKVRTPALSGCRVFRRRGGGHFRRRHAHSLQELPSTGGETVRHHHFSLRKRDTRDVHHKVASQGGLSAIRSRPGVRQPERGKSARSGHSGPGLCAQ